MKLEFSEEQYKTIKQLLDICTISTIDEEEYEHLAPIIIEFLVDKEIEKKSKEKDKVKGFRCNSKLPF